MPYGAGDAQPWRGRTRRLDFGTHPSHPAFRFVRNASSYPIGSARICACGAALENLREMRIPLSAPDITEADIESVVSVLRTPRLSIGPRMREFESAVAGYVAAQHGVAVSSGTAGLHLSLRALGVGEGDEVILPSFTFIAVAHAVLYERAIPVFADIDPLTLNLNPQE